MRLIVEADGGARGNPGPASYGALVRDGATGAILVEIADHIGHATNNVAEYSGLIAGLREAFAMHPEATVEVRMDSKLVVEQMSGGWAIKHPGMKALALEARRIIDGRDVAFRWVPRADNAAADRLANESLDAVAAGRPGAIRRVSELEAADVVGHVAAEVEEVTATRPPNRVVGWATDLGTPTTTILVRHGATEYSLAKYFSGMGGKDVPLSPLGIEQVRAAAREVVERGHVDAVVASPLLRTRQSADIVASLAGAEVDVVDGIAECSFGEWDGHTFAEVMERWPAELSSWLASTDVAPPGGESFAECAARVEEARRQILEAYAGKRVVVLSHVSPIKILTSIAVEAPLHSLYRMELAPASISTVAWWPDGNASLFGFAESAHLRAVDAGAGI